MSQEMFAARLELLKRGRHNVLPLGEAVTRLYDGTLPRRSVAITFDDGNFDFYDRAWPVLERAGVPATVYLTTYYSDRNLPVFPLVISYLLWKRQGLLVTLPDGLTVDTRSVEARKSSQNALVLHAQDERLSAGEKDRLAEEVADALGADYAGIRRRRLLHIMNPSEVRDLAGAGVDFQLHTHRHRSPLDRVSYTTEIADNRQRIVESVGRTPVHFCYPSGVSMPLFGPWLEEEGVVSATTCESGMATRTTDRFQLPRLLDHSELTDLEFDAWLAGIGDVLPRRATGFQPVDRDGHLVVPRQPITAPASAEHDAPRSRRDMLLRSPNN
jgi:peptidoglycan/xylan/chitin deacetylase (PgdA/CDA1 family)